MNQWQPIESAPKDGTLIVGWCVHEADPYHEPKGDCLTAYGSNCEGLSHVINGPHVVCWVPAQKDGDWETGYYTIPGWWYRADGDYETVANPTHWMPLPPSPITSKETHDQEDSTFRH